MDLTKNTRVSTTGVATNCLMYMLVRYATQDVQTSDLDEAKKSFIVMNSVNKSLSNVGA